MTDDRLYNYISGQAGEDEKQAIHAWASESEKRRKELSRLKNIWVISGLAQETDPVQKEQVITQILEKIRELNTNTPTKRLIPSWLKYAAVIVLIAFFSGLTGYFIHNYQTTSTAGFAEINVPFGERSNITLPDGSKVQLNSGSTLKFASSFLSHKRTVMLNGEAFFDVVHNKKRPFVVETSNLLVEVLGTKFNVSSYKDDSFISTYLQSGKVKVCMNDETEIILKPSEFLEFDKLKNQIRKSKIGDTRFTDWTQGILNIKGETIEKLSKKLTRRFGIEIQFADEEVKKHIYSGSIKDENLDTVLEALRFASAIGSEREGNKVKLYSIK